MRLFERFIGVLDWIWFGFATRVGWLGLGHESRGIVRCIFYDLDESCYE